MLYNVLLKKYQHICQLVLLPPVIRVQYPLRKMPRGHALFMRMTVRRCSQTVERGDRKASFGTLNINLEVTCQETNTKFYLMGIRNLHAKVLLFL